MIGVTALLTARQKQATARKIFNILIKSSASGKISGNLQRLSTAALN
jgi:hypothetical protein